MNADWHYIGHYGELGPLTQEQMQELIEDGVVERDTLVWRVGMTDWQSAGSHPQLQTAFNVRPLPTLPPPPPTPIRPMKPLVASVGPASQGMSQAHSWHPVDIPRSDRKRWIAGILQIIFPGAGRLYMGYLAQGFAQLFLVPFGCGIGIVWSIIDGICILAGAVKLDGYGRRLDD